MSEPLLTNPATKWHRQPVVAEFRVCSFSVQHVFRQMIGYKRTDPIFNSYLQVMIKDLAIKKLQILPLPCEYIFSSWHFLINNLEHFQTNSAIHCNTRNKHHLQRPTANLTYFQKITYYSGIKIFNNLPASLRILMNENAKFKIVLKQYLNTYSFYCWWIPII
jgi:hypothetical protein